MLTRAIATDFWKYLPTLVLPAVMGFVAFPVYTRLLSPDLYGQYTLIVYTVGLGLSFGVSWLETTVLRFFPKSGNKTSGGASELFLPTLIMVGLLTILIVSVIWFVLLVVRPLNSSVIPISLALAGTLMFVVLALMRVLLTFCRARLDSRGYALLQSTYIVGSTMLSFILLSTTNLKAGAVLLGNIVFALLVVVLAGRRLAILRYLDQKSLALDTFSRMASYGLPMIPVLAGNWILSVSDRYLLAYYLGSREVGIYSISYSFAEKVILIPSSALMFAATPILINAWEEGEFSEIGETLGRIIRWYLLGCLPVLVLIVLFGKDLLAVLVASDFQEGAIVVPFVAIGVAAWGLSQYATRILILLERSVLLMALVLVGALVNVALNVALIPRYGLLGAGISTTIAYMFLLFLSFLVAMRQSQIVLPWITALRTLVASAVLAVSIQFLRTKGIQLYLVIPVSSAIYFGSLLALGEITWTRIWQSWQWQSSRLLSAFKR